MLIKENIIKETKNNGILEISPIYKDVAKLWCIKNHYSKKWHQAFGIINFGIFRDNELMGAAVYGNLMNSKSYKNISDEPEGSVLELNRLHISDELVKNAETTFLAATFKLIRKIKPEVKFIQSFADGRLGCGTIYKAANFQYCGFHYSDFYYEKDLDLYQHHKIFTDTASPIPMMEVNRKLIDDKFELRRVKTYRYVYELYPKKFKNKMKQESYPPYEKGYISKKIKLTGPILARLNIMYSKIEDNEYVEKTINLLNQDYSIKQIEELKKTQMKNEFLLKFLDSEKAYELKDNNTKIDLSLLI